MQTDGLWSGLHENDSYSRPHTGLISISDDSDPLGTWYNWALPL